jgi:Fe2+ or Zn2+ uptake regulation protein
LSQYEIYLILEELNGKATTSQIKKRAREKFPDYSLHTYVYDRLTKLEKKRK